MDSDEEVLSVPEVAEVLGISRNSAYKAVNQGDIPSVKVGRRTLVPRKAFDQWLKTAGEAHQKNDN